MKRSRHVSTSPVFRATTARERDAVRSPLRPVTSSVTQPSSLEKRSSMVHSVTPSSVQPSSATATQGHTKVQVDKGEGEHMLWCTRKIVPKVMAPGHGAKVSGKYAQ
jgi:hypothetical protein